MVLVSGSNPRRLFPEHRTEMDPIPPTEAQKRAIVKGLIPRNHPGLPSEARCVCGHLEGAHKGLAEVHANQCRAHRCACAAYRQDPRFILPEAPAGRELRFFRGRTPISREEALRSTGGNPG